MKKQLKVVTRWLEISSGPGQGLLMATATMLAGGFDYMTNVVIGRMLVDEFSIFVAVTALLQVMVQATNVIRNVVAFYTAESTAQSGAAARIAQFLRSAWRWAWRWGMVAMALMILISPLLASLLRIGRPWPLLAGSLALLLLFLRPVTDGTLQGLQHFIGLSVVQVSQAILRLMIAPLLLWLGWRAFGAILALPLASMGALLLALWFLRPYFKLSRDVVGSQSISWRYSTHTLLGLFAYALMVNIDPIIVQRLFSTELAQSYSPVVTLGKMNLFIPLGIGLVLFPKAVQRQADGRDPRLILLLALLATLVPGFILSGLFFLFPGFIVQAVFTDAYANPGLVLGLVGLATTLYAGVNIWLNFALSTNRHIFIYALSAIVIMQLITMLLFHPSLMIIALIMLAVGMVANVFGALTTLRWRN